MDDDPDADLWSRQVALQGEAAEVLTMAAGSAALGPLGPLLPMGSYVSGLMCWRDLDVAALVGPDFGPSDVLDVMKRFVETGIVTSFTYRDERGARSPTGERRDERFHLPTQVVWRSQDWRFDLSLWLYDDHAHIAEWHRELGERITPAQRRAVLRIKDRWCRRPEYPDEISGLEIYTAVLEDGVCTVDEFAAWLAAPPSK